MGTTIINVELNGCCVPVVVEYVTDVDKSYGEDADGRGGTTLVSRDILDASIDADHLKMLSIGDAEYVLDQARFLFYQRIR